MADFKQGFGKFTPKLPKDYNLKNELIDIGLLANSFAPVTGDIQSGLLAANDVKQGNYGSAALNSLGLLPFVPALAGTFIGKGAKTWDALNHDKALKMTKKGIDERKIWAETGNFKGADGQWRQEISDHNIVSNPTQPNSMGGFALGNVLNNNDAVKAYPQAYGISVKPDKSTYFSPKYNEIASSDFTTKSQLNPHYQHQEDRIYRIADKLESAGLNSANYEKRLQSMLDKIEPKAGSRVDGYVEKTSFEPSALLHEQQHAIQELEKWNKGGSVREFAEPEFKKIEDLNNQISSLNRQMDDFIGTPMYSELMDKKLDLVKQVQGKDYISVMDNANSQYRNLAGEAEARATQARMNLTPQERLAKFPFDSYDVPRENLIIRGLLGQ